MGSRILDSNLGRGREAGDERRVIRRHLLLGAGAATLGAACGPAEEYEGEEPIDTVALAAADYSNVPSWTWTSITGFFAFVRDTRWLKMDGSPNFDRRVSWLYPDGGCEARAEIISHRAGITFRPKPYKLYAAGALRLTTNNAPPGRTYVTWGFHIAPVVKSSDSGNVYMLDPSVDPTRPLTVSTWLTRINGSANSVVVNPPSYWGPLGRGNIDTALDQMESEYLKLEWDRQVALGRDPRRVLGDNPPW
jgi:hypothetical protein